MCKFLKFVLMAGMLSLSFPVLALDPVMKENQVEFEVQQCFCKCECMAVISAAAISTGMLAVAFIDQGLSATAVVSHLISVGQPAVAVVNTAVGAGAKSTTVIAAAVSADIDSIITLVSAAGPQTAAKTQTMPTTTITTPTASSGGGWPSSIVSRS